MELSQLIEGGIKLRASDIHLMEDCHPYFRIDKDLLPVNAPSLSRDDLLQIIDAVMPERLRQRLEERRGVDIGYQHKDLARCRIIVFYERQKLAVVIRLLPLEVPSLAELELPPVLETFADLHRGMILITGPSGSGKSTTLAAMIQAMNLRRRICITTIEDPIEYLHPNHMAVVRQREIGEDVVDFESGAIQALRQNPDTIMVGEMRNLETMRTGILSAETGHLFLSTLHTSSAIQTMERIISTFPEAERKLLLEQLALNLKVVVTQELVRRAEGKGRVAALEIMVVTDHVAKLIHDNRISDIYELMKSREGGMQTLDEALAELVRAGKITEAEGSIYTRDVHAYHRYIKRMESSGDSGSVLG